MKRTKSSSSEQEEESSTSNKRVKEDNRDNDSGRDASAVVDQGQWTVNECVLETDWEMEFFW